MAKLVLTTFFLAIFIWSCVDQTHSTNATTSFKTFEISYTNGWTRGFSFIVDSNKIYLSPQRFDTTYYGIIPDSVFKIIDTTFSKIRLDTNIKSKDEGCVDCSVLAVKIVASGDTIRINQTGDLDKVFYPLIELLQSFIREGNHQTIKAAVFLETQSVVMPPPPIIHDKKFKPPETTKKNGS